MLILNVVRETLIDDLNYSYAGNQLKAISDAAGEQGLYDQKEYLDYSNAENTMNYDANGNLLADFDRKICTIQYNLLNLPTIIQLCNGNSIVNTYNAEGVKLSSTYYTLPEAVAVPVGEIVEPDMLPQAPQTMIVQYLGHIERTIIGDSVSYTLHHPEGYITLDALHRVDSWNYFRRDHLGNNVAVWNASADTTVQRMFYYPSGLPIGISTGQSAQPYKYNGKEYVEMHGYDVYEYGFRGYYATIARFTSIDPLCERTPWQSPYCYASNNFVGEIDWMGLFGSTGFASGGYGTYQWTAVNGVGTVIDSDMSSSDTGVYLVDDDWDGTYSGLSNYWQIGWQIPGIIYRKGGIYDFLLLNGNIFSAEFKSAMAYNGYTYQFGYYKDTPSANNNDDIIDMIDFYSTTFDLYQCNPFYWEAKNGNVYNIFNRYGHQRYVYNRSYKLAWKRLKLAPVSIVMNLISAGDIVNDMYQNGLNWGNTTDAILLGISLINPWCALGVLGFSIVDMAFEYYTNKSIVDRLSQYPIYERKK